MHHVLSTLIAVALLVGVTGLTSPAAAPQIEASPPSLDFGQVQVGTAAVPLIVTITNIDDRRSDLILGTLHIPDSLVFGLVHDTCSDEILPAGTSCTVSVVFAPLSPDLERATLHIPSNDPVIPTVDVRLVGEGIRR